MSPIRTVRYPEGTTVLWRWTERPEDGRVAAFVAAFTAARGRVQARTRASLDPGDIETLIGYTRRCALAAARTGDPAAVVSALDALSAVDAARADAHDLAFAVLAVAGAAGCAGIPVPVAAAGAMRRADPRVARMLTSVASRPANSSGYRPVEVAGGPVLLFDARLPYRPDRDLVPIALGLAAAFEAEGTYRVDDVSLGTRPPVSWIGDRQDQRAAALVDEMTGCVSLRGDMFLVYLGESPAPEGAAAVAAAADGRSTAYATVLGVAAGRLSAVAISKGVPVEGPERLARLRATIYQKLH